MRAIVIILFLIISFFGFSQEKVKPEVETTISAFIKAVETHDQNLTIQLLDKNYVKLQLKQFLKNNKDQFLNELFSGQDEISKDWLAVNFSEIRSVQMIKIEPDDEENWIVYFKVSDGIHVVAADLRLICVKKKKNSRCAYGFQGAFG